MSVAANQAQVFLRLLSRLRGRWRTDHALPRTIQSLLAGDRTFGSRDRRLYRELIYTTLRYLPWIEPWLDRDPTEAVRRTAWLAAETPATRAFRSELATGDAPDGDRAELLPSWFRAECPEIFSGAELDAQLRRAPLWLRLADDAAATLTEFDELGWKWERAEINPNAVRLLDEVDVAKTKAWLRGRFEVQDLGSQLVLMTSDPKPWPSSRPAPPAPGRRTSG
jgi:16S rRNA (cytosine967-C5)-methyltransferase